jgi:Zn-dependent protease/predicted transcriptional regulator
MLTEFRFARLAGIDISAHWSLLIVFLLICLSLAAGVLPAWHPGWNPALLWAVALATALLFVASVLSREMAHALAGRAAGVPVRRITLFMFGGVSHLDRTPSKWRVELLTAIAAPVTSLLIVLACMLVTNHAARDLVIATDFPQHALFMLGPTGTVFLWLGQINLTLLLFNLLPGFPLDAGRVLRAAIWGITGSLRRATRWASRAGQVVAWLLIISGLILMLGASAPLFGTGPLIGLWLMMVGAFLNTAATLGYRQASEGGPLDGIPVERVMHSEFASADPDMTIGELVDSYVLPGVQHAFPVVDDGKFAGLVALHDLSKVPREAWAQVPVRDVMTPATGVVGVKPESNAADAMVTLGREHVNQLPVIENGKLRGLVSREDILQQLSLHDDPALAQ